MFNSKGGMSGYILFVALLLINLLASCNATIVHGTDGADFLIVKDADPWNNPSNEEALIQLGYTYDVVNSTNFVNTDLGRYKVIIIASDQPDSFYANLAKPVIKSKLEVFVSTGGVLVAHMCDRGWNTGFWDESFLPGAPDLSHITVLLNNLSVADPMHPIIVNSGATNTSIDDWRFSAHGYFLNPPLNATIIIGNALDPLGQPVYIEWKYGRGTVLATMMTIEWGYAHEYGSGKELLLAELRYAYSISRMVGIVGGVLIGTSGGGGFVVQALIIAGIAAASLGLMLRRKTAK